MRKFGLICGWLIVAAVTFATLSPIRERPGVATPHLEHFVAFCLMGLAFGIANPRKWKLVASAVVGAAIGLEIAQLFTPDRHARIIDALTKVAGGMTGVLLALASATILRSWMGKGLSR